MSEAPKLPVVAELQKWAASVRRYDAPGIENHLAATIDDALAAIAQLQERLEAATGLLRTAEGWFRDLEANAYADILEEFTMAEPTAEA